MTDGIQKYLIKIAELMELGKYVSLTIKYNVFP